MVSWNDERVIKNSTAFFSAVAAWLTLAWSKIYEPSSRNIRWRGYTLPKISLKNAAITFHDRSSASVL